MLDLKHRYEMLVVPIPRGARRNRLFSCLRIIGLISICLFAATYFSIGFDDLTRQRAEPPEVAALQNVSKLTNPTQRPEADRAEPVEKSKGFRQFECFIESKTKKIIFIETRVEENFCLKLRQSCAVESAARMNPGAAVVLLVRSSVPTSCKVINELKSIANVMIVRYTVDEVFGDTPLLEWGRRVERGEVKSPYMSSHLSDAIRLAVVHKYSAIYADLDFIMIRSFDKLFQYEGFMARQDSEGLNGALFGFHGLKNFTRQAMEEFRATYRGHQWAFNGPLLMQRILERWGCHVQDSDCRGLTILDPVVFYPVPWPQAKRLFQDDNGELASSLMSNEKTLAVHFWNYLTHNMNSTLHQKNVLNIFAKEKCPTSFQIAREGEHQDFV